MKLEGAGTNSIPSTDLDNATFFWQLYTVLPYFSTKIEATLEWWEEETILGINTLKHQPITLLSCLK